LNDLHRTAKPTDRPPPDSIRLQRELTDVGALLRSSLEPLRRQAADLEIDVRVDVLGTPPKLSVDPEKIAWAVTSLVGNALRYVVEGSCSRPGGCIIVHVTHEPRVGEVLVAVHDDGPGISDEKMTSLFHRREGSPHAAGIGLLMVREVAEAHGGRIHVESRCGAADHGTSITLVFPVVETESASAP